ncbi:MAG: NAD/NADP octopine/nopaline dehydrogenase family protein [bacterium]
MITVGIFGASSQSGMAYFADFTNQGIPVVGYVWDEPQGIEVVNAINYNNGINLIRPENINHEGSKLVKLKISILTHDISELVDKSDIIIIAIPSHLHFNAIQSLKDNRILNKKIPIILSPSRTFATPYIWKILEYKYPIICFSTSPYSAKTVNPNTVYIKRRKRTWTGTIEGNLKKQHINIIKKIFPQVALTKIPSLTSLNNIGAVFHPATYILNYDEICYRNNMGIEFSYYIEGIANNLTVGDFLEKIDQTRLEIANYLGIESFGYSENTREDTWRKLTKGLRALEDEHEGEIEVLRRIRKLFVEYLNNCVLSSQHWLDITYGVERIENESLSNAIRRTPTYQKNSFPQIRYIEEDIPTGLVPFEALAIRFNINHNEITYVINEYDKIFNTNIRMNGRNLEEFSDQFIINYLTGKFNADEEY